MKSVHATSVSLDGKAILIKGASGVGKSSLALELIGFGAKLIADDQTELSLISGQVFLSAPSTLPAGLEIRGVGIIDAPMCKGAGLKMVVDLSKLENKRFPNPSDKKINVLGYSFPFYLFQGIKNPAAAIYALMKFGMVDI